MTTEQAKIINMKKNLKTHFRGQNWVRVIFQLKYGFETTNSIYPENLGLLDIFLSKKGQLRKILPPSPTGTFVYDKLNLILELLINMV